MQIRLLNLDRSTDRLALFRARNARARGIVRVPTVDGKLVSRRHLIDNNVICADLSYSDGALGCALSHLTQWRDAIEQNLPLTIVEDDAVLCANFEQEAGRVLEQLPDDWEYVMWGYNFDAPMTYDLGEQFSPCTALLDQQALRENLAKFPSAVISTKLFKLLRGFGTVAYSISPRGAMRLMEFCMPLRPLDTVHPGLPRPIANRGIDNMIAHAWPHMRAFVAVPPLVVTENHASVSTIQDGGRASPQAAPDSLPPRLLLDLCEGFMAEDAAEEEPVVVGIRAANDAHLPTQVLRNAGWNGFDIALDPQDAVKALRDRSVPEGFALLYVGPGCNPAPLLERLLAEFRPALAILPPEQVILAEDLGRWHGRASGAWAPLRPTYLDLARSLGYAVRICPGMPSRVLLVQGDVGESRSEQWPGRPGCNAAADPDRSLAVRLWH